MRYLFPVVIAAALLSACATGGPPPSGTLGSRSFTSRVTVTGTDVPGPLRLREVELTAGGADGGPVPTGGPVEAVFTAWINGHGTLTGHWERDGKEIERLSVILTYGETLVITLDDPQLLGADRRGEHTARFVVESPATDLVMPTARYRVGG